MKSRVEDVKILVVGDIMLDIYISGTVDRISPEAPVPVVHVTDEYYTLGGCGNVVRNIRELGAQVDCLASVHMDYNGEKILDELDKIGAKYIGGYTSKETIVKERIIASSRKVQMLRIDRETIHPIDYNKVIKLYKKYRSNYYDFVIISDYAKGMITKELMDFLKYEYNETMIVDPKPINGFLYNNVYMITPNKKEWEIMKLASQYLLNGVKYILETKGKEGMTLYDDSKHWDIPAEPVDIFNVSGAGDSVVAIMGVCLSLGHSPVISAKIANKCAGYVVTQAGTSVVPQDIFINNIVKYTGI